MKKSILFFAVFMFFCTGFILSTSEKRAMTVDDALNMAQVGNPLLSPDGKMVFFSKSELDWKKNKRTTRYYMIPSEGGTAYQYIGEEGGSSFQFSPDGRFMSFKRQIEKKNQLFLMPTSGGEAVKWSDHPPGIGEYKWSPDSQSIYFTSDDPKEKEEDQKIKDGYDSILVDEGPNGQTRGEWRNLWKIEIPSKKITQITKEQILINDMDISPDGTKIIFTAQFSKRRNDGYKSEIYLLNLNDNSRTQLTENLAPESSPLWAPDGESLIFLAADIKKWMNRNSKIWILNPASKSTRLLSGSFEGDIREIFWKQDSRTILFNGQQGLDSNLYQIDSKSGKYQALTKEKGTLRISSFSRDRTRMAYIYSDYDTPSDVYSSPAETFTPTRLTHANPWIEEELLLASLRTIQWKSVKGFTIEGLLHLPAEYQTDSRLPLILNIHGGPAGCFTNSFRASYHIHAGLGYASLSPNVRGSSGYTDRLREGNTVQAGDGIGMGDYWDLIKGVEYVIEMGVADPDRLALRGWSYGGILGGWTITQTDRFKAASIGAGVYDWASEYGPGFNHDVSLWHIGGTPWENPEAWRRQSTYTHVKNISTPTLIIHGMNDTTDTEAQSMLLFTALKDIGKAPVRYIRVPREPHGFREPRHQRTRDIEEIRWMEKYVKGVEWNPWERPEEKKNKEAEQTK